jgi:hypothetical protein
MADGIESQPGTRERCNPYTGRPGAEQNLGNGAHSGPGGEYVVNQKDVPSCDGLWIGNQESTTDVVAALAGGKARLAIRCPLPHHRPRSQRQAPAWMGFPQHRQRTAGKQSCLVISALRKLRPV